MLVSRPTCAHDKVHSGISSVQLEIIPPREFIEARPRLKKIIRAPVVSEFLHREIPSKTQIVLAFRGRTDFFW